MRDKDTELASTFDEEHKTLLYDTPDNNSSPDLDTSGMNSDIQSRLHDAINLTIFRTDGSGRPCPVDDVTKASEKDNLVPPNEHKKSEQLEKYRIQILVASWSSMVILGALGTVTFVISLEEESNASFAFALDAMLVCLSSIVLIWRYGPCGHNKPTTYSAKREKIACIILGILFYVSAVGVIIRSLMSLIERHSPNPSNIMWKIFIVNAICCTVFSTAEVYLAAGLSSISIAMDAINTGVAGVLSISTCVTDVVYLHKYVSLWYIDALIGVTCGIVMIVYSTWAMAHVIFHDSSKPPP